MSSLTASEASQASPNAAGSSPARTATIATDDLGITVRADLRITGLVREVRDLFASTSAEDQPALLEKVIVIGATSVATTAEISASDAARMKLERSTDALLAAHTRVLELHEAQGKQIKEAVEGGLAALRTQISDSGKQEEQLRKQIRDGQAELIKVAKQLDLTRDELEKRAGKAITNVVEAQTKAKEEVVKGTETALKKLLDKNDPGSAPSLIGSVMGQAAADMRETTNKNIGDLVKELSKAFGESSPLVEKIAKTVREGAEAEIKRVEEQVEKLRADVLARRTREEYSPHLIGDGYEDDLLLLLGEGAAVHGWTVDRTGTQIGDSAGSKKGDHVLTDELDQKIAAIEARARKNVSAREFYEGLRATAVNRGVKIVIYCARSVSELPSGLGEFSRGRVPLHYKQLADGVHALATVIDPESPTVVERLAITLWLVGRLSEQKSDRGTKRDALVRIAQALPLVEQITSRLSTFRAVKSGLTKADGEIEKVREKISDLEETMSDDLHTLEQILSGCDESATPEVA